MSDEQERTGLLVNHSYPMVTHSLLIAHTSSPFFRLLRHLALDLQFVLNVEKTRYTARVLR